MSRFQLLVFTLVVAAGLFICILHDLKFPDIPPSILYLVGISATTYGAGKAITYSRDEGVTTPDERSDKRDMDLEMHKVTAAAATNAAVANAAAASNVAAANAEAVANANPAGNVDAGDVANAAAEGAFAGAVAGVQVAGAGDGDATPPATGGPASTV